MHGSLSFFATLRRSSRLWQAIFWCQKGADGAHGRIRRALSLLATSWRMYAIAERFLRSKYAPIEHTVLFDGHILSWRHQGDRIADAERLLPVRTEPMNQMDSANGCSHI
jgi:hypothetical protein